MTRRTAWRTGAWFAVCCALTTTTATADPVVITSGDYSYDTGDPASFAISGDGFTLRWAGFQGPTFANFTSPSLCFTGCTPGVTTVDFSTALRGMVVNSFPIAGTLGDTSYERLTETGDMIFSAAPFTFPSVTDPSVRLASPFTFSGHLTAFADPSRTGPPLFDADLVGAGTARLLAFQTCKTPDCSVSSSDSYSFAAVTYTFEDVSATPEPATILLLAAGLVTIARRLQSSGCLRASPTECTNRPS